MKLNLPKLYFKTIGRLTNGTGQRTTGWSDRKFFTRISLKILVSLQLGWQEHPKEKYICFLAIEKTYTTQNIQLLSRLTDSFKERPLS